jgi:hypothetical protein
LGGHCPSAPPVPAATAQKINSTTIEDGLPTLIHPALPLLAFPVDLAIHNKFNDLPLAPENRIPPGGKVEKLLCHFYDKKNYKIHYKTLKLYKSLGIRITKVHRGIKFTQSNFIASGN